MEEIPIISIQDRKLIVTGKAERVSAHSYNLIRHATALIVVVTPEKRILLADVYKKKRCKARLQGLLPQKSCIILDCFGGHLKYEDIPKNEMNSGLTLNTFLMCAKRELLEELWITQKNNRRKTIDINTGQFFYLDIHRFENDHNKEISASFIYFTNQEGPFQSKDNLIYSDGKEEEFDQPIYALNLEDLLCGYASGIGKFELSDGIGRILHSKKGIIMLSKKMESDYCKQVNYALPIEV